MPDQVPDDVKRERIERLVELVQRIACERNMARIGNVEEVLVEGASRTDDTRLRGRTRRNTNGALQRRRGSRRARPGRDRERDLHDAGRAADGARRRMTRRRAWIAAQLLFVVALVVFLGFALEDTWADAGPRLRDADVGTC